MLALSGQSFTIIDHFEHPFEFWCEISFYPIHQRNRIVGTACFSRDITERKRNEENFKLLEKKILEQKIQEHRKIARAIIKAQERERNHLGQELHDNINQILAGTKLYLGVAGKKNEAVKELIKYPMELIDSSIEEMRLLCHKMVTPVKNISLEELFKDLIISLDQNTITKTYFTYSIPKADLSDDLKLNIFRIIQELVNNTWKYAEAKNVEISIQEQEEFIHIDVSDDGKGFDVEKKRGGIGISNIINRVESFNGEIEIESSPGKGCKTKIRIPY
jgi:signal transduction histidine kinase